MLEYGNRAALVAEGEALPAAFADAALGNGNRLGVRRCPRRYAGRATIALRPGAERLQHLKRSSRVTTLVIIAALALCLSPHVVTSVGRMPLPVPVGDIDS